MPWIDPPNQELYPAISDHAIKVFTRVFFFIKYLIPHVEREGLGWESEGLGWESEGLGWPLFHFY